ncbi:hypothetical protein EON62_05420, partial [archaeon]
SKEPGLASRFVVTQYMGQGSFCRVSQVEDRQNKQLYALKVAMRAYRSERDLELQLREFENWQIIGAHPNLVSYERAWVESAVLHMQLELCAGGSVGHLQTTLQDKVIPEPTLWRFLAHVAAALAHMHSAGYVHLDIKPDNVLISGSTFKVGDLGLSQCYGVDKREAAMEGDCKYMAPEVLNAPGPTPAADVFSLGISAFELAWGVMLPQDGPLWSSLRQGELPPMNPSLGRSPELVAVIRSLMSPSPAARPTATDILKLPQVVAALHTEEDAFLLQYNAWLELNQSAMKAASSSAAAAAAKAAAVAAAAASAAAAAASTGLSISVPHVELGTDTLATPSVSLALTTPVATTHSLFHTVPVSRAAALGRSQSYTSDMISGDLDMFMTPRVMTSPVPQLG